MIVAKKNKVFILSLLIPVLYMLIWTILCLLMGKEKISNLSYAYFVFNIYYMLVFYIVIGLLIYDTIIYSFDSGLIINELLYPIRKEFIFLKKLIKVFIGYFIESASFLSIFLVEYTIIYGQDEVYKTIIENCIYSAYSQIVMILIILICAIFLKTKLKYVVFIFILLVFNIEMTGFFVTSLDYVSFFPNVLISIYTIPKEIPLIISNLSIVINMLYAFVFFIIYCIMIKKVEV